MNRQPNILFLMVDQMRADHLGLRVDGAPLTPHLDALAARSTRFHQAVSVNPVCQPARCALLTGRYPHQIGMTTMNGDLRTDLKTVPAALRRQGYHTAIVGKLHFLHGTRPRKQDYPRYRERQAEAFGFDHVWEASGKELVQHHYCDYARHLDQRGLLEPYLRHLNDAKSGGYLPGTPLEDRWPARHWPFAPEDYVDVVVGGNALAHLRTLEAGCPFYLHVSFCGPHPPYDPLPEDLAAIPEDTGHAFIELTPLTQLQRARLLANHRRYLAMIRGIDRQVGRILSELEARGLRDSTLVAFTSDHGEMLGDRGAYNKSVPWRSASRIPLLLSRPGHASPEDHCHPVELTDLPATFLAAAGLDPRQALDTPGHAFHSRIPGRSLLDPASPPREYAFSSCNGEWVMVESRRWKLIRFTSDQVSAPPAEHLYDLDNDPGETHNLAGNPGCREVVSTLREHLLRVLETTPPCQSPWPSYP